MKKSLFMLTLLLLTLALVACTNKGSEGESYQAKASDFNETLFENAKDQYIGVSDNQLIIHGSSNNGSNKTSSLDAVFEEHSDQTSTFSELAFDNPTIETKGNQYVVKADGDIELVFTKIGERTIKDEDRNRYTTPHFPE